MAGIAEAGFALAGSGAIREHGVINRPTEDVDLFTTEQDTDEFARAVERVVADLRGSGYEVEEARRAAHFARLAVSTGEGFQFDVDAIRRWGRFTDEELVSAAAARDAGFEVSVFAQQLEAVRRVTLLDVERYGISAEQLSAVNARCMQWAAHLRGRSDGAEVESSRLAELQRSRPSDGFPRAAPRATSQPPRTGLQRGPQVRHGGPYLPGHGSGTGQGR
nr:nucleotidyl transferase AbiEii/AbiGii toxin family protein [Pseudactinotalea sp. HY160]